MSVSEMLQKASKEFFEIHKVAPLKEDFYTSVGNDQNNDESFLFGHKGNNTEETEILKLRNAWQTLKRV